MAEVGELLDPEYQVGDLIRMDFDEAHILVHDALRLKVGGVPHSCLLVAAKPEPSDDPEEEAVRAMPSLLLLRVLGGSTLPNDIEMQQARFQAVTSRKLVSECTILINSQLAACSSTSSPEVTSGTGDGSSVTIVM